MHEWENNELFVNARARPIDRPRLIGVVIYKVFTRFSVCVYIDTEKAHAVNWSVLECINEVYPLFINTTIVFVTSQLKFDAYSYIYIKTICG